MKHFTKTVFFLFVICTISFAQTTNDAIKREALTHMQYGRYGEAIDLLNKYISALPHKAEGLHLRGLCYEKRSQYEWAALDLRRAVKLAPDDQKLREDLERVEKIWHELLNKKIEGHKREIAINPNVAVNYLEIGKCKKNLGEWKEAEQWYDEYLKRDENASPDEVIRYSEILSKNGSIVKGEKILKKYVEKYPDDQRLWSRYGFFTMWLGKNKIAIMAFENALALKPYFKEAQDGLDQAKGKPYLFEWVDTLARRKAQQAPPEFTIDKYYRIVRKNPEDSETRLLLVQELMKYERMEEAYQQLQILQKKNPDDPAIRPLMDSVTTFRDVVYKKRLVDYNNKLAINPKDKEAALKVAEYQSNLTNYDSAIVVLENYLQGVPDNQDSDVRFRLAQYSAWNYDWERAITQLNILLTQDPNNLEYQMLRGQISVWNTSDLDLAEKYLTNVYDKQPDNFPVLLSLSTLYCWKDDFTTAKKYLDLAGNIDANDTYYITTQQLYETAKANAEERKILDIRVEGGKLAMAGDCEGALAKYDEYFTYKTAPEKTALMEYAEVNMCVKNFSKTIEICNQILEQEYDYNAAMLRAKAYLWGGDSLTAVSEFQKLANEDSSSWEAKFYLAESYQVTKNYDEAKDLYELLLENETDSTKIKLIQQRIGWIPVVGIKGIISNFPNSVGFAPIYNYYSDNFDLIFKSWGGRLDLGLTSFLTIGTSFSRGDLSKEWAQRNYTILKAHLNIWITSKFVASFGFGNLTYQGYSNRNVSDITLKYENKDHFSVAGLYDHTDAALILYSPSLVYYDIATDYRILSDLYKLLFYYFPRKELKFSGYYQFLDLTDGNLGNDLQLRVGKLFEWDIWAGYEYFYSNYARKSKFYYSPSDFESHSLWLDWIVQNDETLEVDINGKVGYVPASDFLVREVGAGITYKPMKNLAITGKITLGSTYRYDTSYRFISSSIYAYWSF